MLCAHTVRRLKPGTFDQFLAAFRPDGDVLPGGWVRFHALRGLADENEVVTFGSSTGRSTSSSGARRRATTEAAAPRSSRTSRP
jgi:hypothetical protein